MKDFIHVLGVLSRDMMVSRGHFLMVRNLDGGAQREHRARNPQPKPAPGHGETARAGEGLPATSCAG